MEVDSEEVIIRRIGKLIKVRESPLAYRFVEEKNINLPERLLAKKFILKGQSH